MCNNYFVHWENELAQEIEKLHNNISCVQLSKSIIYVLTYNCVKHKNKTSFYDLVFFSSKTPLQSFLIS